MSICPVQIALKGARKVFIYIHCQTIAPQVQQVVLKYP